MNDHHTFKQEDYTLKRISILQTN